MWPFRRSIFQNEIADGKWPPSDRYGIISSKFDPRKVSGISRIAVINFASKCALARVRGTRFEYGFYQGDCLSIRGVFFHVSHRTKYGIVTSQIYGTYWQY